jgi:hypothetical protein
MGVMDETTWSQEVRMEGEGEIGLAVGKASAGPLADRDKALDLPEKRAYVEARQGRRKIDLVNSDAPESQPWERL